MQHETLLHSYIVRVVRRAHRRVFTLQDLRTGEQLEFTSSQHLSDYLRQRAHGEARAPPPRQR